MNTRAIEIRSLEVCVYLQSVPAVAFIFCTLGRIIIRLSLVKGMGSFDKGWTSLPLKDATPKPVPKTEFDKSSPPPTSLNQVKQPKQLKAMRKLLVKLPKVIGPNEVSTTIGALGAGMKLPLMVDRLFKDVPGLSSLVKQSRM